MIVSVLIVDDHQILLQGLAALLEADPSICLIGTATDERETLEYLRRSDCDLIVCDVSMPNFGAESLQHTIEERKLDCKVLALSAFDDPAIVRPVLEAGVSGYVLKREAFDQLVEAIHVVASGSRYIDASLSRSLEDSRASRVQLSEREMQVLVGIVDGDLYKQIAARIGVSVRTIETYRARLLEKTGCQNNAQLIRWSSKHPQ